MINWIDIVSADLRAVHRRWCELRGRHYIPHLTDYNRFVTTVSDAVSLSAVFPGAARPPAFRSVGAEVHREFPELHDGIAFPEIHSVTARTTHTVPFHGVHGSRQPDCRRGVVGSAMRGRPFEQLLLPFGDDQLRVRLVHALYEFAPLR